jgi:hypothetical protein
VNAITPGCLSVRTGIVAAALAFALVGAAQAGELKLAPPGDGDRVPSSLSTAAQENVDALESAPVQAAWRLDPDSAGTLQHAPGDAPAILSVRVPSARLTGAARSVPVRMRDPVVYLEFDVEVAATSRYQIGGVLYGTDNSGAKVPLAMAQSAQRLEPGVHGMTLLFGPDILDSVAAGAPWEIRDLQLVNLADMSVQEQRERALVVESVR